MTSGYRDAIEEDQSALPPPAAMRQPVQMPGIMPAPTYATEPPPARRTVLGESQRDTGDYPSTIAFGIPGRASGRGGGGSIRLNDPGQRVPVQGSISGRGVDMSPLLSDNAGRRQFAGMQADVAMQQQSRSDALARNAQSAQEREAARALQQQELDTQARGVEVDAMRQIRLENERLAQQAAMYAPENAVLPDGTPVKPGTSREEYERAWEIARQNEAAITRDAAKFAREEKVAAEERAKKQRKLDFDATVAHWVNANINDPEEDLAAAESRARGYLGGDWSDLANDPSHRYSVQLAIAARKLALQKDIERKLGIQSDVMRQQKGFEDAAEAAEKATIASDAVYEANDVDGNPVSVPIARVGKNELSEQDFASYAEAEEGEQDSLLDALVSGSVALNPQAGIQRINEFYTTMLNVPSAKYPTIGTVTAIYNENLSELTKQRNISAGKTPEGDTTLPSGDPVVVTIDDRNAANERVRELEKRRGRIISAQNAVKQMVARARHERMEAISPRAARRAADAVRQAEQQFEPAPMDATGYAASQQRRYQGGA